MGHHRPPHVLLVADVAFGSKTVLTAPKRHVRVTPRNGQHQVGPVGPVHAKPGRTQSEQMSSELVLRELPKAGPRRLPEKHREGGRFPVVDSQARNLPARILLLSYLCWRVAG